MRASRVVLGILLVIAGLSSLHSHASVIVDNKKVVYRVTIDSTINPGALELIKYAIKTAESNNASALIVVIDTPGGLLSTTRDIVGEISSSKVPVVSYVGPSGANAGSAGAFILLASHIAVMNKGTNVGASTPISGDGEDIKGTLGKKILNDSKAFMRSIAEQHGRNVEAAEKFVSEAMSLSATEALEQNIIDIVVRDPSELLATMDRKEVFVQGKKITLNVTDAEIREIKPRLIDSLLLLIAHPQIAQLLLSFGLLAIYIEIISPGLGFPGIFGAIAVILGMIAVQTLPVNSGFLILLVLGVALMTAEYFVSGFGALGIGGALAFIFGSLYLYDAPTSAEYQSGILSISIAISAAMVLTSVLVSRSLFSKNGKKKVTGKTGEAMINFDSEGYVLISGERWSAITSEPLKHGDNVMVTGMTNDDKAIVRKHTVD